MILTTKKAHPHFHQPLRRLGGSSSHNVARVSRQNARHMCRRTICAEKISSSTTLAFCASTWFQSNMDRPIGIKVWLEICQSPWHICKLVPLFFTYCDTGSNLSNPSHADRSKCKLDWSSSIDRSEIQFAPKSKLGKCMQVITEVQDSVRSKIEPSKAAAGKLGATVILMLQGSLPAAATSGRCTRSSCYWQISWRCADWNRHKSDRTCHTANVLGTSQELTFTQHNENLSIFLPSVGTCTFLINLARLSTSVQLPFCNRSRRERLEILERMDFVSQC
jgi:hypothetical protein